MRRKPTLLAPNALPSVLLLLAAFSPSAAEEPIVGGPCEGCELVFVCMPDHLTSRSRIAPSDEPGEPLRIEGVTLNRDREPEAGIIVYAYHTNASGIYPESSTRHGQLRGWARTDHEGRYRFDTIRPGAYPGRGIPQHVHMHVIEPGRATYWITSIRFGDDPLLTDEERRRTEADRGGSGVVEPKRDSDGVWVVRRDIILGLGVPGYPR